MPSQDEKIFAALIFGISYFTAFIGPIVIWILKKDSSSFVDHYGREYLNFLISYFIYGIVAGISVILLIGFILLPLVGLASLIITIMGIVKALEGSYWRVPFIIRFF